MPAGRPAPLQRAPHLGQALTKIRVCQPQRREIRVVPRLGPPHDREPRLLNNGEQRPRVSDTKTKTTEQGARLMPPPPRHTRQTAARSAPT